MSLFTLNSNPSLIDSNEQKIKLHGVEKLFGAHYWSLLRQSAQLPTLNCELFCLVGNKRKQKISEGRSLSLT